MTYLYILAAVVLLAGSVSTCNYVQKVNAQADAVELEKKAALEAKELAEANLAAQTENARRARELEEAARQAAAALDAKYSQAKEEIRALKNRKPVPKECVSACRDDFAPVARVVDGMRRAD